MYILDIYITRFLVFYSYLKVECRISVMNQAAVRVRLGRGHERDGEGKGSLTHPLFAGPFFRNGVPRDVSSQVELLSRLYSKE